MRVVLQRVTRACVTVEKKRVGEIGAGLVVLLGIAKNDSTQDAEYLLEKIFGLRVFDDPDGRMNVSIAETGGSLLIVSQFTLLGDVRRGRRPSWSDAEQPEVAEPLYEFFVTRARQLGKHVATGSFRQIMEVELVNDGPMTMLIDSRKLF